MLSRPRAGGGVEGVEKRGGGAGLGGRRKKSTGDDGGSQLLFKIIHQNFDL